MRILLAVLLLAWSGFAEVTPRIYHEDFSNDPSDKWRVYGETNLFSWSPESGELAVTWDSSNTNSYYYLPFGLTLTRYDDFRISFTLQLGDVQIGTDPLKPYTFQLAIGLINTTNAFDPEMHRGSGVNLDHGARNVVEFDYFPDSGLGATVAPTLITENNQIAYSHNYPLELVAGAQYRIEMVYAATNRTLQTKMTVDGQPFGQPPDNSIKDLILTEHFTNFVVNAFAICSYSDAGQSPAQFSGSILAHGTLDDVDVTIYNRPALQLVLAGQDKHLEFQTALNWRYDLESSDDLINWTTEAESITGNGQRAQIILTEQIARRFFHLRVQRP
jgi:hypothetical protein